MTIDLDCRMLRGHPNELDISAQKDTLGLILDSWNEQGRYQEAAKALSRRPHRISNRYGVRSWLQPISPGRSRSTCKSTVRLLETYIGVTLTLRALTSDRLRPRRWVAAKTVHRNRLDMR